MSVLIRITVFISEMVLLVLILMVQNNTATICGIQYEYSYFVIRAIKNEVMLFLHAFKASTHPFLRL